MHDKKRIMAALSYEHSILMHKPHNQSLQLYAKLPVTSIDGASVAPVNFTAEARS